MKLKQPDRCWAAVQMLHPTSFAAFWELWFFECASSTAYQRVAAALGRSFGWTRYRVDMPGINKPRYAWAKDKKQLSGLILESVMEANGL